MSCLPDVELNAMILAASQTGRPQIVEKLKHLRGVWLGFSKHEEQREAKEAALLKEVERVDRAAAKISIETERLKKLRDEAMEIVRRVEPGLLDSPPHSRPMSTRSTTQDDMLFLNKDLKNVRDMILSENLHDNNYDNDDGPKLTEMFGKSSHLRRHGSYGSLGTIPPPMPLMNNWGGYPHPGYPQQPHVGEVGYPPYDERYGYYPYMYGQMPPPPPMYHDHHHHKLSRSELRRMQAEGGHGGYFRPRPRHGYDRDVSSEGENTSNDACDLSSSEASGSGRRRKNKCVSPNERPDKEDQRTRKSRSKSPVEILKIDDCTNPIKTSTPKMDNNIDKVTTNKELSKQPQETEMESKKVSEELVQNTDDNTIDVEARQNENLQPVKILTVDPVVKPQVSPKSEQLKRMESEQKFVLESGDEEDDGKLYSSETDSSVKETPSKKTSVDRERKVGLLQNPVENNAYQQMLHGGMKKPTAVVVDDDDDTSSDDIEAQLAMKSTIPKSRNTFAAGSSLHNLDDDSINDTPPTKPKQEAAHPMKMSGMGGHPMPFGIPGISGAGAAPGVLLGGKLGHPLAQRAGMMALASSDRTVHNDDNGNMSAPDNDDDDDFWS